MNSEIPILNNAVYASTIIMLFMILCTDLLKSSDLKVAYYTFTIALIIYCIMRIKKFILKSIHNQQQMVAHDIKDLPMSKDMRYNQYHNFERQVENSSNNLQTQRYSTVRRKYTQIPNQKIVNLFNSIGQKRLEDSYEPQIYFQQTVFHRIRQIINQKMNIHQIQRNNQFTTLEIKEVQNAVSKVKAVNLSEQKKFDPKTVQDGITMIQEFLQENLESTIYQHFYNKLTVLNKILSRTFSLTLSSKSYSSTSTLSQLRTIVSIYKRQKTLPIKYKKSVNNIVQLDNEMHQIENILKTLPDIQNQLKLKLIIYCMTFCNLFRNQQIIIIDGSLNSIIRQGSFHYFNEKPIDYKSHMIIISKDYKIEMNTHPQVKTNNTKYLMLLFVLDLMSKSSYSNLQIIKKLRTIYF